MRLTLTWRNVATSGLTSNLCRRTRTQGVPEPWRYPDGAVVRAPGTS
jgi:hypothetical protein